MTPWTFVWIGLDGGRWQRIVLHDRWLGSGSGSGSGLVESKVADIESAVDMAVDDSRLSGLLRTGVLRGWLGALGERTVCSLVIVADQSKSVQRRRTRKWRSAVRCCRAMAEWWVGVAWVP